MKPDRSGWLRAARGVVPADFLERVLEPALEDLRTEEIESGRATPMTEWLVIGLECMRLLVPRPFWTRGRLTPLGRGLVALALALLVAWWLAARPSYPYRSKASSDEAAYGGSTGAPGTPERPRSPSFA